MANTGNILQGVGVGLQGTAQTLSDVGRLKLQQEANNQNFGLKKEEIDQRRQDLEMRKQEFQEKIEGLKVVKAGNNVEKVLSQPSKYRKQILDKSPIFRNNLSIILGYKDGNMPDEMYQTWSQALQDDSTAKSAIQWQK